MASPSPIAARIRPIAVGHLRALQAVAQHLNFRAAAAELSLTQSAVSRQIQALEDDVGVMLFLRHTRSVELTEAGSQLLRATTPSLERIDSAVRSVRATAGRKSVGITTWASFASMWLIPRLEAFQADHPGIDIRIDASDQRVDLEHSDIDVALRYTRAVDAPSGAIRMFGEQLAPVASPWLLKKGQPLARVEHLARFALIEASEVQRNANLDVLGWPRWLAAQGIERLEPKRWLYFNYAHQIVQAALSGQGIALARTPLVADALASGELVEVMPGRRLDSPLSYWLVVASKSAQRPEIRAFCGWIEAQAQATRLAAGEPA